MRPALIFALLVTAACNPEPAAPPATSPQADAGAGTEAAGPAVVETPRELSSVDRGRVLAPSPLEHQERVKKAGVADSLAAVVPTREFSPTEDKNTVAVRTGVLLTDAVLAGPDSPKETFLARLKAIRGGMESLGTGEGLLSTIDDFVAAVENDTASRQDFIEELDAIAGMSVPEEGWGPDDRTGPLLQAGAWLEGVNLVATVVLDSGKVDAATELLHQPEVPDYFLRYVRTEGGGTAPPPVLKALDNSLSELSVIAKKESLTREDVQRVKDSTEEILKLL